MADALEALLAQQAKGASGADSIDALLASQASSAPTKAPESPAQEPWWERQRNGLASAPINAYLGIKQMLPGGLSDIEKNVLQQNREAGDKAPIASIAGNALMLAPTAFIPGANTVTGAGLVGAVSGLINPADSLKDRALNTAVGGAAGAAGQVIGNKVASFLTDRLATSAANAAKTNALSVPKNAVLEAGQDAGYVVPPSSVNPSWINKRLESLAGKAAVGQEAAARNQQVTNALARKSVGLADDVPVTEGALAGLRDSAGSAYQEVGNLSAIAKQDLEALKAAKFDANAQFKHYNRSADPAALVKAKDARALAQALDESLQNEASAAGRDDLIPALNAARTQIAKTYDLGRALSGADTGEVSAPVIGRLLSKGSPLSGDLETIGKMQQAFPAYLREGAKIPTPGVSKSEALAGAALAFAGHAASGNPLGWAAGALPLLSGPARSLVLSRPYQSLMAHIPTEAPAISLRLAKALANAKLTQGAIPALAAQGVLSAAPVLE